jgi:hypothetical protein
VRQVLLAQNKRNQLVLSWLVAGSLFCAALPLGAFQENRSSPPHPSAPSAADEFTGAWKLNTNKSSRSGIEREVITIEIQGNDYKFLYDWLAENGTELNWWFVTDMKGACVKNTQVNGRPMSGKSCITRIDSRTFVDDTAILKDEYRVSSDGQELIVHRTFVIPPPVGRTGPRKVKLVFDRVPTP